MPVSIPDFPSVGFDDPRAAGGSPVFPANDAGAEGMIELGKGVAKGGQALADIAGMQNFRQQKINEALATADLDGNLIRTKEAIKFEKDPAKLDALRGQLQGFVNSASQTITDPAHRQLWAARAMPEVAKAQAEADIQQHHVYKDRFLAGAENQLNEQIRNAQQATDPADREKAKQNIGNLIERMVAGDIIPAHKGQEMTQKAGEQIITGTAHWLDANEKPQEALDFLKQNGQHVDPQTLDVLTRHLRSQADKAREAAIIDWVSGGPIPGTTGPRGATVAPGRMSVGDQKAAALRAGFKGEAADIMAATSMAESGGNPYAANEKGEHSYGITQINADAHGPEAREALGNPDKAMELAYRISKGGTDFSPWTMYKNGRYKQYMGAAQGSDGGSASPVAPVDAMSQKDADAKYKEIWKTKGKEAADAFYNSQLKGGGGAERVDALSNPDLNAQIAAAPAAGEPIPLDRPGADQLTAQQPIPSATAPASPMTAPVPGMDTREERLARIPEGLSEESYNRIYAGVNRRYSREVQATSAERATALSQYKGGLAMLEDGRDFSYDPNTYRKLFPTEQANQMLGDLEDARNVGQQIQSVRGMSPADINNQIAANQKVLENSTGEGYVRQKKLSDAFVKAADKHIDALTGKHADPAGYVAMYTPGVAAKWQAANDAAQPADTAPQRFADYATATLAEQQRLGVPDENRAVLPAGVAAQAASRIASIDPAKQSPGEALAATARSYGSYWPQVFGDLVKAKLPGAYQVLATMDRPDQIVAAENLSRAIGLMAEKGGMRALKKDAPDDVQKNITAEIDNQLSDFRESTRSQAGGGRLYATVSDAVEVLAYYNGFQGKSQSEAVRSAVDGIINAKYDFGRIGTNDQVRVPKGTLGVVERAADVVKAGVNADQLGDIPGNQLLTPAERKTVWLGAIERGGWANNNDDSGIVLMGRFHDNAYRAIRRADGSRIEVKFDDAPMIAKGAPLIPIPYSSEDIGARPGQR